MRYAYYPGCSLEVNETAHPYQLSVDAVAGTLGIELVPIDDWSCCGATEYWTQDELVACAVIARNLARVDPALDRVTAPCAACYLNLKKVDTLMAADPGMAARINEALAAGSLHYEPGRVAIRHLLDVLVNDVGEAGVRAQVVRPLEGLRVAPYYGCQVVRPHGGFDDPELPSTMDAVLAWIGATPVPFAARSACCGGHMSQISEPEAFELMGRLLREATRARADLIACVCPMCQFNVDAYQARVNAHLGTQYHVPIVYLTQLMGLAFGHGQEVLGLGREIVSAAEVLETRLVAAAAGGGS